MAMDIAQIGFAANTSELVDAKNKLNDISPAAKNAERSSERLSKVFDGVNNAANKLTAAANGLNAAAEKLTAAIGAAANANNRKAQAVNAAAAATAKSTATSNAAAAASGKEAVAVDSAAKAVVRKTQAAEYVAAVQMKQASASDAVAAAARAEAQALDQATAAARRRTSVPSVGDRGAMLNPEGSGRGPWGFVPGNDNPPPRRPGSGVDGILAAQSTPSNIAAQFQDIGVTAAMGMNPLLIALQQGTQLSMAFQGGLGGVLAGLKMMLGPTAILTIAVVGLAAALLQAVNWTGLAQTLLNGLADILPTIAVGVAALGAAVTLAFAPAILTLFWNTFITMAAGIVGLTGSIIAAIGAVPLAIGIIIGHLIIFRDEWAALLGVDVIAVAKDSMNVVIGIFVGAYNAVKSAWEELPTFFSAIGKSAYNSLVEELEKPLFHNEQLGITIPGVDMSAFKASLTEAEQLAMQGTTVIVGEAMGVDYLGEMAEGIVSTAEWASGKLRALSAGLSAEDPEKRRGRGGKTEAEKFSDIVSGAERSIATMEAERAAIGLNAEAAARLRYETQLLNEAKQKGIDLSAPQRTQLEALAADMARVEVATAKAKAAFDSAKEGTKSFLSDVFSGLQQGKSFFESFADAAINALNKLVDKLLNDVVDAIFEVSNAGSGGGKGGGLGGLLGGIGSWLGGLFKNAKGNAFLGGISGHSNSVVDRPTLFAFASGTGLMGEAGPEAIMPLTRGPDGSLGVQNFGAGSGGGTTVIAPYSPTYQVGDGASKEAIEEMRRAREEDMQLFNERVVEAINDERARNRNI